MHEDDDSLFYGGTQTEDPPGDDVSQASQDSYSDESDRDDFGSDDLGDDEAGSGAEEGDELDGRVGLLMDESEAEFDRLVQSIRSSQDLAGGALLNKIWDMPEEEAEIDFHDELRAASGIGKVGRGKGKGKKGARKRTGPVLSHQVRALVGEGNQAYVDGNLEEAIRIMHEVIRIEPRATSAWSVLSACHRELNQPEKALQLAVIGAHLRQDKDEWFQLALQSKEAGQNQQALYCLGKALSLDPSDSIALWDRALLCQQMGDTAAARRAYLALLKYQPHSVRALTELRPILVEFSASKPSELRLCADLYQRAFDYYTSNPRSDLFAELGASEGDEFGLMELLTLGDLRNALEEYEKTIIIIRGGVRWLQGRVEQKYWDACEDDREYDLEGVVREMAPGDLQSGFHPLNINARHRLAIARLKLGELSEGKLHADVILSQPATEFSPLFVEIADVYFGKDMFEDAKPIYELLGADAGTSSVYILLQAASCRRNLGDLKEAADIYEHVIATDPSNLDAKMKLAEIYEISNEPKKALDLVYQVIDSRSRKAAIPGDPAISSAHGAGDAASMSLFSDRPRGNKPTRALKSGNRLTKAQVQELERQKEVETLRGYSRIKHLWPLLAVRDETATQEWLLEAEKLVESFRETRSLFLTSISLPFRGLFRSKLKASVEGTEEENMASRLHLNMERESAARKSKAVKVTVFRGIEFDDWLVMVLQYAFTLTENSQFELAEEVLRHVLVSNAFQSRPMQDTLRIALAACGLKERKFPLVVEQCRKLVSAYQFNNEPFRILLASLASGLPPTDTFIASTLQKHLFRELKLHDAAVKGKGVTWNSATRRYNPPKASEENDDDRELDADAQHADIQDKYIIPEKPTKDNPLMVTLYGQTCTAAKSYQSALFYLLHAYDYCPRDPLICLSLAIASIGRAMQRQADNRNYLITQGLGFLTHYRRHRGGGDESTPFADEVEYNYGRAFHQLGLLTHAVHHYERVHEIIEKRLLVNPQDHGVAKEAAYNLSLIFVATGAPKLAESLHRKWLSL